MSTEPHVFVVEASAGSGKTHELARRYIRLLIKSSQGPASAQLRSILAITFTNKAAVEMKERILELLKKLALDCFASPREKEDLLAFIGIDEEPARARAFACLDAIIGNYNFFQVQTIDSFINAVLSGCAFRLGLSANFRIKNDYSRYVAFGLDSLVERAHNDKKILELFREFLHQYIFLEYRAGWFPKKDLLAQVLAMYEDSNSYAGDLVSPAPISREAMFKARQDVCGLMRHLLDNEPEGANQTAFKSFRLRMEKYSESLNVEELCRPFAAPNLPVKKNFMVPAQAEHDWQKIRDGLRDIFEAESLSFFNCYIRIFDQVYEGVAAKAREEDVMFLQELNRKARLLFDEQGITVPELYYRLATRFRHYLIDEFQDTSVLQWKNLRAMVEEALSTGGSLFYVGDTKQAIFRFRGGDASLFHSVREEFKAFGAGGSRLTANFRSAPEIVAFNNGVFSVANLGRFLDGLAREEEKRDIPVIFNGQDRDDILAIFGGAEQTARQSGCGRVKIERVSPAGDQTVEELTREKVIGLIPRLRERFGSYGSIAVLCRSNQDIESMTSWLLEAKLPVESEKTLNIREHPLIKELLSFLRFLESPIDDLSFASFILGDMFTRASGIEKSRLAEFLFERNRVRKDATASYLYRDFRQAFPGEWDAFIEEFFRNVGFVPLYELVASVYSRFELCRTFPWCQAFLMKFMETVKLRVDEENTDLSAFIEYFDSASNDQLYVRVRGADAVTVMSIHKSKGLEFDCVILPFMEIRCDPGAGRQEAPYLIDPGENSVRLLRINKSGILFSERLERLYRGEYKRLLIDELNTMYVACTRARKELYGFIPPKSASGSNSCLILVPAALEQLGAENSYPSSGAPEEERIIPRPSEYRNWIPLLKEEFIEKSEIRNRQRILEGEVMHRALASIGNGDAKISAAAAARRAVDIARPLFPVYDGWKKLEGTLVKALSEKRLSGIFSVPGARIRCEVEIVDAFGRARRIDRLIEHKDGLWIVDYKSSRDEQERGAEQVREYSALIKQMRQGTVRAFLLFMDSLQLEEIHG